MNPALAAGIIALLGSAPQPDAPEMRDPECVHDCWTQYHTCMGKCWDALHDNVLCDQMICNPQREQCDAQCPVADAANKPDQQKM